MKSSRPVFRAGACGLYLIRFLHGSGENEFSGAQKLGMIFSAKNYRGGLSMRRILLALTLIPLFILGCAQQVTPTASPTSAKHPLVTPSPVATLEVSPTPSGPNIVGTWEVIQPGQLPNLTFSPGDQIHIFQKFIVFPGGQAAAWYPASATVIVVDPRFVGGMFAIYIERQGDTLILRSGSREVHLRWKGPVP